MSTPESPRPSVPATPSSAAGRTVLIAGATSAAGHACAAALQSAGARVIAVGSNADRLAELAASVPGTITRVCDLGDLSAVEALAAEIRGQAAEHGHGGLDGLVHLVGGWRGGGGLAGQSDEDWRALEAAFGTLRNTTRAFNDDLLASDAGRLAIVSSTSVERPLAGGANYAAAKAAADAWTRAVAQGFAKATAPEPPTAAAVVFVVKSLAGLEPQLAADVVGLWSTPASALNGSRITLSPAPGHA
ncbi:SDR family NAD(P)-dependent oxidoreductase [Microterricola viridarii]|uniref:Alcohol dehydrogenase n=1 Tax=Microterricola viridarii TaxID=412690 RepID=A0A0Y0PBX1_9MICO|nr:SDR family NAD(P)-dependent oxidoreductase [Microterricola viridarii]AMB60067.1 alcohol dehydrogenase [Microterricola viridarii]